MDEFNAKNGKASIRQLSRAWQVPRSTLQLRQSGKVSGSSHMSGRKPAFDIKAEANLQLAQSLTIHLRLHTRTWTGLLTPPLTIHLRPHTRTWTRMSLPVSLYWNLPVFVIVLPLIWWCTRFLSETTRGILYILWITPMTLRLLLQVKWRRIHLWPSLLFQKGIGLQEISCLTI